MKDQEDIHFELSYRLRNHCGVFRAEISVIMEAENYIGLFSKLKLVVKNITILNNGFKMKPLCRLQNFQTNLAELELKMVTRNILPQRVGYFQEFKCFNRSLLERPTYSEVRSSFKELLQKLQQRWKASNSLSSYIFIYI